MRTLTLLGCLCCLPLLALMPASLRTTSCEQQYQFFFKTPDEHTFWIGEDLFGECGQSQLIQVFVEKQSVSEKRAVLSRFAEWDWVERLREHLRTEQPIAMNVSGGQATFANLGLRLRAPAVNTNLQKTFNDEFKQDCAPQWNKAMGRAGIDLPSVAGAQAELIYVSPRGLYFNYHFDKAYLFPESNLILLFTHNEQHCIGGDTMHGFMILRFKVRV